jgi:Rps23 Pro-64 3,4-dihydroxylase Tpa1-like proline 4-hydroxylase
VNLNESQQAAVDQAIYRGQKIEAIKLYRIAASSDLKDAKEAVEARESYLRSQDSSRFSVAKTGCLGLLLLSALPFVAVWMLV